MLPVGREEEDRYWLLLVSSQQHQYPCFVDHLKEQVDSLREDGRAAVVDFVDGEKPSVTRFQTSRSLRRCLDKPVEPGAPHGVRRLVILEGLPRNFVQVLGAKLRIPPDFFAAHWIEPDGLAGNQVNRSPRHYDSHNRGILSFVKLHQAEIIALEKDASSPLYFMESTFRRRMTRTTIFGDFDGPLSSPGQASFWSASYEEGSWIVLVDPPLGGFVRWRNDPVPRVVSHDPSIPLVRMENLGRLVQQGSWYPLYQSHAILSQNSNEWLDSERTPGMKSLLDDMVMLYPLTVRVSTANPNDCNDICRKLVLAEWTARLRIIEAEIACERLKLIIPKSGTAQNIDELLESSWPGSWRPRDFARLVRAKTVLESIEAELRRNLRALGVVGSGLDTTPRILSLWETDAWETLHEAIGLMASKVEGTMHAYMQASSVRQTLSANEQAVQVGRLTSMATIFLPVSLVAAIFSMGGEFAAGERMFWVFWVIAVPVGLVGCFLLFTTAGRNILR